MDPLGLHGRIRTKPIVIGVQGWVLTLGIELLLAADIRLAADDAPPPPVWVHCSGGVGRTGVFLTALSVFRTICPTVPLGSAVQFVPMADADAFADAVAAAAASLREQRHPWMVEGEEQYVFAHMVVYECTAAVAEADRQTLGEGQCGDSAAVGRLLTAMRPLIFSYLPSAGNQSRQ